MRLLCNHIGYDIGGSKIALIEFPGHKSYYDLYPYTIHSVTTGREVYNGKAEELDDPAYWMGSTYREIDFSAFDVEGSYTLSVVIGGNTTLGACFEIGRGLTADSTVSDILFYLKSQRCSGPWDERDRSLPFVGSREGTVDLHGGWYDASGDYSKYLSHLSYADYMNPQQIPLVVWSLLELEHALGESSRHRGTLLQARAMEEALWGADFLVRMQDPAGYFYTTVFDRWSKRLDARMVTAFRGKEGVLLENYQAGFRKGGGMAIASLARAAMLNGEGEYSRKEYLRTAEKGWAHLCRHNIEYLDNGVENIIDHYCAVMAAVSLYRATGGEHYLIAARRRVEQIRLLYCREERCWMVEEGSRRPFYHASDAGLPLVALCDYLDVEPVDSLQEQTAQLIGSIVEDLFSLTKETPNPFRLLPHRVPAVGGGIRSSWFIPHDNETGYWWQGENARLASIACGLRRIGRYFKGELVSDILLNEYSTAQIDWILGLNPFDICMLQGRGRNNPGYEEHYPNAPGGICNGITYNFNSEEEIAFLPPEGEDGDNRWRWSEQWLPHAAWFLMAVAAGMESDRSRR